MLFRSKNEERGPFLLVTCLWMLEQNNWQNCSKGWVKLKKFGSAQSALIKKILRLRIEPKLSSKSGAKTKTQKMPMFFTKTNLPLKKLSKNSTKPFGGRSICVLTLVARKKIKARWLKVRKFHAPDATPRSIRGKILERQFSLEIFPLLSVRRS